ncbi:hypothetical protein E2C01_041122 [Portunus trituberculatus]|uniref:Uncharacterized protein n=1 Tax=Portunus trituberculatus TaxID=210409 RepID=A0A5B7FR20_PORTR|nr:hypothetical protein [Portunus trituberculatus]
MPTCPSLPTLPPAHPSLSARGALGYTHLPQDTQISSLPATSRSQAVPRRAATSHLRDRVNKLIEARGRLMSQHHQLCFLRRGF